jgi:PAS domain S-box-containing protein
MDDKNTIWLSHFILDQMEPILQAWEEFAKTIEPPAFTMDSEELRDHASLILGAIADDLRRPQSRLEQSEKSKGRGPRTNEDTAAETHAVARLASGYTVEQLVSEYRALRASVLHLLSEAEGTGLSVAVADVTRFNEGIDQALAESVARFAKITKEMLENERQRLDAVLEAAPVGIVMTDANGKLVLSNPETARIWGHHPLPENVDEYAAWKAWWADGSGKHGHSLAPHEWTIARALSGDAAPSDRVEIEPFGSPGERRSVMLHAKPIRDKDKQIVGAVVAQMDISPQVKAEEALRESEAKFRTIANAMPQMVWSTRADGYHDYYNEQWYNFTGMPVGSTEGELWNNMFHPDDQHRAWAQWQHSLETGETYEIQYRLRHRSGEYRWTLGRALPVRDTSGRITRWMGTCTDIHTQKLAEEELRESNRRKDEFLAMLAHELRNPLAPISTAAELIKLISTQERRIQQASDIISRQVSYMTDLIDDLLDVSRVTRGLTELHKESVNLKAVIYSAVEQVRPLFDARQHQLRLLIGAADAYVLGDKTRLVQVIANILNNAAKYTPQGGEISLALEISEAEARIRISDNGSGIAPSLLPHVFDLFTQGERTPDRAQGGLGLGLALVKSLTTLHNGWVEASSKGVGLGSTFTVGLPLQAQAETGMCQNAHESMSPPSTKSLRLMIVDDNSDAAHSLASLLETKGHQVVVVGDGESALTNAAVEATQVFILDIGLPDMDGYELARRLRAKPEAANAMLIALSGYGQAHDRVLSKAAGFDCHFVKPNDTQALIEILNRVG